MKKLLLLILLLIVVAGCSNKNGYTPSKKDIVEKHGELKNFKRLDEFVENIRRTHEDGVRVVRYTIEGDPIIFDLIYNGKNIKLTSDTTRDEYGEGDINTTTCKSFQKAETEVNIKYHLSGCQMTNEFDEDISVLEMEK